MKGTHLPKTKTQLSDIERELLTTMLNVVDYSIEAVTPLTSRQIDKMMNWNDIRKTTSTLSNLAGMDLIVETEHDSRLSNEDTNEFSSNEPLYFIMKNSVIYKRAVYARDRKEKGTSLWHITHGVSDYGKNLWPFRPTDKVKAKGRVVISERTGLPTLKFAVPKELGELVDKEVRITIDLL